MSRTTEIRLGAIELGAVDADPGALLDDEAYRDRTVGPDGLPTTRRGHAVAGGDPDPRADRGGSGRPARDLRAGPGRRGPGGPTAADPRSGSGLVDQDVADPDPDAPPVGGRLPDLGQLGAASGALDRAPAAATSAPDGGRRGARGGRERPVAARLGEPGGRRDELTARIGFALAWRNARLICAAPDLEIARALEERREHRHTPRLLELAIGCWIARVVVEPTIWHYLRRALRLGRRGLLLARLDLDDRRTRPRPRLP